MRPLRNLEPPAELFECSRAHAKFLGHCVQRKVEIISQHLSRHLAAVMPVCPAHRLFCLHARGQLLFCYARVPKVHAGRRRCRARHEVLAQNGLERRYRWQLAWRCRHCHRSLVRKRPESQHV